MAVGIKLIKATGQKGFIGSHLVSYLKTTGCDVDGFAGDLLNTQAVREFMERGEAQVLVHMAGTFNPPTENLTAKNVTTTANILSHLKQSAVRKIVYLSSAAVYGEPRDKYSRESDAPSPNTEYGSSKLQAEELIRKAALRTGFQYVILRFPGVYGGKGGKGVIDQFISGIKLNGKIMIYGDGTQRRNFLHIDDACDAIGKAINYERNGVFNIASTEPMSLNSVVGELKHKYEFTVEHQPANNELKDIALDISLARQELGFKPAHTELEI